MRNIDRIKELESKRKEIYDILGDAYESLYASMCKHCKNRTHCLYKDNPAMRDIDECANGLENWLNAEVAP